MTSRGGATRSPAFLGIDHVQLAMPPGPAAEDEAERFYVSVLGFERVPKPAPLAERGGCWFRTAAVQLHLGVEEPFRPTRKAHPALLVDSLDTLAERLASAGHPVQPSEDVDGRRRVHVDDPFGNRLELIESHDPTPEVFRIIADTAVNPFSLINSDGELAWVSASIELLLGWSAEEVIRRPLEEIISPESLPDVVDGLAGLAEVPTNYPRAGVGVAADLLRRDGSTTSVDLIGAAAQWTGLPWHIVFAQRAGYQRAHDRALRGMAENAELQDVLTHLGTAVEQAVPHSSVAVCDRWRAPRFGITAGNGVGLLPPDADAPWARALATGEDVWVTTPDDLSPGLASFARARGLASY